MRKPSRIIRTLYRRAAVFVRRSRRSLPAGFAMRQLFLRFYLTVVVCFLASALIIGGLYKHMIERINQHYLTDIFQTTISIVEDELGDLPQSIWHSEISRMRGKLPVPVEIEQLDAYTLSTPNRKALADGDIILLEDEDIYLHRIPDTQLIVVLGPVPYLNRLDNISWPDILGLLLMCAALGIPTWLWMRPFYHDLRSMIRQSRAMGSGDFKVRAELSENSPLSSLGSTFNRMAHDVEELTASRQQMIDAISHDLRTPLARMRYRLEALKAGAPAEAQTAGMERDLEQIDQLVEEWLTLRKLERSQMQLEIQPLEILPWLERQLSELSVGGNIIPLENTTGLRAPLVSADSYYLSRVLSNLISNAKRYGGGKIQVVLSWSDGVARLMVDDNGPGIPESERERLLQPFERLESSRNRNTGGYGLGLAIVAMVMRGHGGNLRIETSPMGGARALLFWPTTLKDANRL
ncbi:two-component system sensor histidine kinase RstB [Silvimonas terrae]|uniref:histidine kinase n=1 Tax=Silvimonas terrae TaxID=300266 RepID=A0A840RJC6_9NEIS|nr:ATP-binding protein [Silvimonas terrae]MBB5192323.1 two-component system sensor histidine kinase RstB [Silvimonas terrae]